MTLSPHHLGSRSQSRCRQITGSGMGSTGVNMITKNITSELSATLSRECQLHQSWYVSPDTNDKEGLPETTRPGFIPVMRSNQYHKTHFGVSSSWGLRVPISGLRVKAKLFNFTKTRDRESLIQVFKLLTPSKGNPCFFFLFFFIMNNR